MALDKTYRKEYYNPDYRGVHLERSVVSDVESVDELYLPDETVCTTTDLCPPSLTEDLEKIRNLVSERKLTSLASS